MSLSYILDIKNIEYFTLSLKNTVEAVEYTLYEPNIKTLDIFGTFSQQDTTDIDTFIQNYTNPERSVVKNKKILSSTKLTCVEVMDWCTLFNWIEKDVITSIDITARLEPSNTDYLYNEVFRYEIRIVDITNNQVLSHSEFYNSEYEDKSLNIINFSLSLGNIELEIQVKKYNKGNMISIRKAIIEYN